MIIKKIYLLNDIRPIKVATNVKQPINAATNTVPATDASGWPTAAVNMAYTIIINPIKANKENSIGLTLNNSFSL